MFWLDFYITSVELNGLNIVIRVPPEQKLSHLSAILWKSRRLTAHSLHTNPCDITRDLVQCLAPIGRRPIRASVATVSFKFVRTLVINNDCGIASREIRVNGFLALEVFQSCKYLQKFFKLEITLKNA
jgi:hypothetical protein